MPRFVSNTWAFQLQRAETRKKKSPSVLTHPPTDSDLHISLRSLWTMPGPRIDRGWQRQQGNIIHSPADRGSTRDGSTTTRETKQHYIRLCLVRTYHAPQRHSLYVRRPVQKLLFIFFVFLVCAQEPCIFPPRGQIRHIGLFIWISTGCCMGRSLCFVCGGFGTRPCQCFAHRPVCGNARAAPLVRRTPLSGSITLTSHGTQDPCDAPGCLDY